MNTVDRLKIFASISKDSDLFYDDNRLGLTQDEAREILARIADLDAKIPKWASADTHPHGGRDCDCLAVTDRSTIGEAYYRRGEPSLCAALPADNGCVQWAHGAAKSVETEREGAAEMTREQMIDIFKDALFTANRVGMPDSPVRVRAQSTLQLIREYYRLQKFRAAYNTLEVTAEGCENCYLVARECRDTLTDSPNLSDGVHEEPKEGDLE